MVLDMFRYEGVEVVVSYFPVWEMFFSMHVLSNPEHHLTRRKWVEAKEKSYPDLIKEIRDLGEVTDSWILIIDSEKWSEIRQMEIVEMLHFFRNKNIYQWNEWVKRSVGKEMSVKERNRILDIVEKYYKCVFKNEEMILRPYLVRILQEEKEKYLICNNEFSVRNYFSDSIFAGMGTKSSTNFSTNTCSCAVSKCGDRASEFSRKLFADITGFSSFICLFGNWRSMVYLDGTEFS